MTPPTPFVLGAIAVGLNHRRNSRRIYHLGGFCPLLDIIFLKSNIILIIFLCFAQTTSHILHVPEINRGITSLKAKLLNMDLQHSS